MENLMKILNLFFSTTGNTAKVAQTISITMQQPGNRLKPSKSRRIWIC